MNVTVEDLGPCKKLLRVELDVEAVEAAFERATSEFQRHVSLPGFRPGKAPRHLVAKTYASRIEDDVRQKLLPAAYKDALAEQKLRPAAQATMEVIQFSRGQPVQLAFTVEIEPEFELPEYKGLPVRRDDQVVTDDDVERAIQLLREQQATYLDVARPVQPGDFVVVTYTGTCEGRPILELAPDARGLAAQKNFWLHVETGSFVPGFTDQLIGAQAGERRTVTVMFPGNFVEPAVAGKPGVYEVEVVQVKEKAAPALDEELAKVLGAPSVEALRAGVRRDLENELDYKQRQVLRDQLVTTLLGRVTFELPPSLVEEATKAVVYDIVRSNAARGVPKDTMDEHEKEIYHAAKLTAKDRVKASFLLHRIAEKEDIKVSREELSQQIYHLAAQQKVKPERLAKQLQESGGVAELQDRIISGKVLDLLELHATVQEDPS